MPDSTAQAAPPLPPWVPVAAWLAGAALLAYVVLAVVPAPGPLDDPDQADQRTGFLIPREDARRLPPISGGLRFGARPTLLLFDRRTPGRRPLQKIISELPRGTTMTLVLAGTKRAGLARLVGMPRPRDGGYPVGYAIVDRERLVRYVTLDPTYLEHGLEIATVVEAVE